MRGIFHRFNTVETGSESDSGICTLSKRKILSTSVILRISCIICLATSTLMCILLLVTTIPGLHLPSTLEDAKYDVQVLKDYTDKNEEGHNRIFIIFCLLYLWKQTFCVPGSILLNLIAGALYGMASVPLLCFLTAFGSTLCYYIFYFAGAEILEHCIPKHLSKLRTQIEENRSSMFLYLLTLRLFPLAPYWLINIVSPFVGVPVWVFFMTCMLGIIPYNFVTVEAGQMLSKVDSISDILNPWFMGKLLLISAVPFIFSILAKKNKEINIENGDDWEEFKEDEIGLISST
ncbi:Transmembrane protein 41A [Basidiobolus ranarum]|uniref:Transmembrane protein 41A n=1 Tax=Basidiobolus ranarum TaxID=34480 RepID=A0ABR2W028_9FUNG